MQIEPVLPNFNYLRVVKSGGIMGIRQSLTLDKDLKGSIVCGYTGSHGFSLDATTSQELMQAIAVAAAKRPAASTSTGCDLFQYDIEISWGNNVYRVSSVDLGADEALLGVMYTANQLISTMTVKDVPHEDTLLAPA